MNSPLPEELLSAWLDGALSPEESAQVETLLRDSPEAQKCADEFRELGNRLRDVPSLRSPDLAANVLKQAERESLLGKPTAEVQPAPVAAGKKPWWFSNVSVISSVAAIVLVGFFVSRQFRSEKKSQVITTTTSESASSDAATESFALSEIETDEKRSVVALERMVEAPVTFNASDAPDKMVMSGLGGNATLPYLSAADLKNAVPGDIISALKLKDQDVVVVQLTVVDRRQVLNSLQFLLSDLNITNEAPSDENGDNKSGKDDLLAVYVEADQSQMELALTKLQSNMDIASMDVATIVPTQELDSYFVSNGYGATPMLGRATAGKPLDNKNEAPRFTKPLEQQVESKPATTPAPLAVPAAAPQRALAFKDAALPPPPPLAEPGEESELLLSERKLSENNTYNYARQRTVRLPQQETFELIQQNQSSPRNQAVAEEFALKAKESPNPKKGLAESALATKPAATPKLMAKQPVDSRATTRPVQILFLVIPEMPLPASEAGSPGPKG